MIDRVCRRLVQAGFDRLREGRLVFREGESAWEAGGGEGLAATVHVHDARMYRAVVFGGHIGAAEAYARGWWTTDDLTRVVRVLVRNRDVLDGLETGWARMVQPLRAFLHWLNRNTRSGSRRNIVAHYDLGNEFFRCFLDETMTYSCAYFASPTASLAEASRAKYERLCERLDLSAEDHVVEIGTGWGGFAVHAAERFGCRITTTTISAEQYAYARARVRSAGLDDRVTVLHCDYRDLPGTYDKLVSIEMIEAVGHHFYDTFFSTVARLVAPGGRAAIQAITIQDRYYEQARREVDFIKKYIFPGSCIPSVRVLTDAARRSGLRLVSLEDIGLHYAETLHRWRENFMAHEAEIERLGFDGVFRRIWEFYFCYCEGGFLEGAIGDAHLVFAPVGAVEREPWAEVPAERIEASPPVPALAVERPAWLGGGA